MQKPNLKDLRLAQQHLTKQYRIEHQTQLLSSVERDVYLQARMPATQTVCEKVLAHIAQKNITSMLDLGCGPGSATMAAVQVLPQLQTLHLVDRDAKYEYAFGQAYQTQFFKQDFQQLCLLQAYDLIVLSYALSECNDRLREQVLTQAWGHTQQYLVVIEPGTPYGYASLLKTRQHLIGQGAFLMAPCPHECACPLVAPDWCHFKVRLQRSKIHQQIKQGTKSFEDESYSFAIFSKQPMTVKNKCIIKKPMVRTGHILFELCTADGLQKQTVSKKDKICYMQAKKLAWGEVF